MTGPGRRALRIRACAKINLTLRVLRIRDDGYHELRTTFQSLALHDTLTFTARPGPFAIACDDPHCPTDRRNLVWKAAAARWDARGGQGALSGVAVHLRKRIPAGAGLGGGSSDAASTLIALRHLWHLRVSDEELESMGARLGADVPFFLRGGTVLGVERGDLLFPLVELPRAWVVLARPGFGVSTREAYGWWDEAFRRRAEGGRGRAEGGRRRPGGRGRRSHDGGAAEEWTNDLEGPVVERHPAIGRLVGALRRAGATYAAMSGSGSAVFGTFDARDAAAAAAARVGAAGVRTWVTRTLARREYRRVTAPVDVAES
jgi:4-diphosphocytidyl-2-C-methyl-D-erythritol kinase